MARQKSRTFSVQYLNGFPKALGPEWTQSAKNLCDICRAIKIYFSGWWPTDYNAEYISQDLYSGRNDWPQLKECVAVLIGSYKKNKNLVIQAVHGLSVMLEKGKRTLNTCRARCVNAGAFSYCLTSYENKGPTTWFAIVRGGLPLKKPQNLACMGPILQQYQGRKWTCTGIV